MAWTTSKMFSAFAVDALNNAAAYHLNNTDACKAALFDNTVTPDSTVSTANSAYAGGVWAAGGVSDSTDAGVGWPAVGRPLVTVTCAAAAGVVKFDAADTVSTDTHTTLAATYGCLVYDDDVADGGICFNYFGGANSVTLGTFTIVWNGSGIATITV